MGNFDSAVNGIVASYSSNRQSNELPVRLDSPIRELGDVTLTDIQLLQ